MYTIAVGQPVASKQKQNVHGVIVASEGFGAFATYSVRWDTLDGSTERDVSASDLIECEWCKDYE